MGNTEKFVTLERLRAFGVELLTKINQVFVKKSELGGVVGSIEAGSGDGEIVITNADGTTGTPVQLTGVVGTPTYDDNTKQLTLPVLGGSSVTVTMEGGAASFNPTVASENDISNIVDEIFAEVMETETITIYGSNTVAVGDTLTLTATTVPAGKTVTWSVDDTTKATIDGGIVTGVSAGAIIVTASFVGSDSSPVTATKSITVTTATP